MKKQFSHRAFRILFIIILSFLFINKSEVNAEPVIYLEWVDNPLTSMVINWIENDGGSNLVEYREAGSDNWSTLNATSVDIPGSNRVVYRVNITGLSAGTAYQFRVADNSEIYKFRTAPSDLEEPMKFIVGGDILDSDNARGDFENSKDDFAKVSREAAEENPYFAVLAGDLAHADGLEEFVSQWFDFFEIWQENMVTEDGFFVPIAASPGNHEVPNGYGDSPSDAIYYYTFFSYPQDQWGSKISYGTLDFSNYLSIVTLDTDHTHRIPGTQTTWLNNTLRNRRNFRHVVPAYHVAGWPTFRTLIGTQENLVRNNWHKVFRDNDIRLVFEHHDHIYKRTRTIGDCEDQISNSQDCTYGSNAKDGVIYMGGGAWGSENSRSAISSSNNNWYLDKKVEEVHNFVVVEITNNYREAKAIGENGQIIDTKTDYVFLDPPEILPPDNLTEESFTARWEEVDGADSYLLDVSTDSDFDNTFRSYSNKDVGSSTSQDLNDLDPSQIYYYRVRARNVLTRSEKSDVMEVQLVQIDPDLSSLTVSNEVVQANKEDISNITATIYDEDGELVENFRVTLFTEEGNLRVEKNPIRTNEDGEATFDVSNIRPEVVTYGVLAGNEEITDKVSVTFIPRSPVALSASNVENRTFTANWEVVQFADYYELDLATDEEFNNIVQGYNGRNVGEVTSFTIEAVNPGTEYFYRVRAVTDNLIGANSQSISTTTFPDTPEATESTAESVVSFNANWNAAEGAENYLLDVSTDPNFDSYVDGYQDLDVGNALSYEVEGLLPGRTYYYRVQAEAGPRRSPDSNVVNTTILEIDTENSLIQSEQLRVLANGEQSNEIRITILAENGGLQANVPINLIPENGNSEVEEIQPITDEEGVAIFGVTNTSAQTVTYSVVAATVDVGEISVEFLENEGVLSLGHNFPNPFRFETSIPLTIPESMYVKLEVYNSLGAPVRLLLDEEIETGYYEVPFHGAYLAAGVYFYRLMTDDAIKTRKMVLVK